MGSAGYARALRARWLPIAAVTVAVTCLAVLVPPVPRSYSQPSTALEDVVSPAHTRFRVSATLGVPPGTGQTEETFRTIAFYVRSRDVTVAFADRIGYEGTNAGLLGRLVTVAASPAAATFTVSGFGGTRQQAADITNAYVLAVQSYLQEVSSAATATRTATAQARVEDLKAQIETLGAEIQTLRDAAAADAEADPAARPTVDPQLALLQAQYDALATSYSTAYQELTRLNGATGEVAADITILQPPTPQSAVQLTPSLIYQLPVRLGLGLLLGLVLGAALALLLAHFGRRVSSRDAAEQAFRTRVLSEVPGQRITGSARDVVIVSAPTSGTAAAYRMLRAVLLADQVPTAVGPDPLRDQVARAATRRLVTSPAGSSRPTVDAEDGELGYDVDALMSASMAGGSADTAFDGLVIVLAAASDEPVHSVVVANLAASFAESGRGVTVLRLGPSAAAAESEPRDEVSARPRPGALDGAPADYEVWAQDTSVAGVQTVDWRPDRNTPAAAAVVAALRAEGSVVLVDAGRVATAEFAEVAPIADGVVAVAEYGRTRIEDAERAAEIIAWSRGSFLGVVLAQVPSRTLRGLRLGSRERSPLGRNRGEEAA